MMTYSLLPCPVCGGDPCLIQTVPTTPYSPYFVYCKNCYCSTSVEYNENRVIDDWNNVNNLYDKVGNKLKVTK